MLRWWDRFLVSQPLGPLVDYGDCGNLSYYGTHIDQIVMFLLDTSSMVRQVRSVQQCCPALSGGLRGPNLLHYGSWLGSLCGFLIAGSDGTIGFTVLCSLHCGGEIW
jgi:hypothetical protein